MLPKKRIIIIIIILVLLFGIITNYGSLTKPIDKELLKSPGIKLPIKEKTITCKDIDKENIGTKGTCRQSNGISKTDYCSNNKEIVEYYCDAGKCKENIVDCTTNGFIDCQDGTCICGDLDNDGFTNSDCGGSDCYDSLMSAYFSGMPECNLSDKPIFLASRNNEDDISDHTWIQDKTSPGKTYHLFYMGGGINNDIMHYTSENLEDISYIGPALIHQENTFYERQWAPNVVEYKNKYYMFYTAVENSGGSWKQRIGLAVSNDLNIWTRPQVNNCQGTLGDGCIYECQEPWSKWGQGGPFTEECRDPFVIRDPINNRWVMFATTKFNGDPESYVITVAYSYNLIDWTGAGYIDATRKLPSGQGAQKTGFNSENAFVTYYDGTYYLLFTDWSDNEDQYGAMTQYAISDTLSADSSGSQNWIYKGHIPDKGVNAIEVQVIDEDTWIMSQRLSNENSGDSTNHWGELRLKRIIWGENYEFSTSNLTRLSCRISSSDIHPGATDICGNGVDEDCNSGDEICVINKPVPKKDFTYE